MGSEIAILIPHFNNPIELEKSVLSINETIVIDIVIVDDGSVKKPNKERLKKQYVLGKLHFINLEINKGIEHALNNGLQFIKDNGYKYIGRLDCGDLCKPQKFKKQISKFYEDNDLSLLGTWVNIVDKSGDHLYVLKHPVFHKDIQKKMYLNSMFVHPSVVFKTSLIEKVGYYPTNYEAAEDYAFFFKIIKRFKAENYPEALLDYIIEPNSISSSKRNTQVKSRIKIILKNFYFGWYPIYGLSRNIMLLFMSRNLTTKIKKLFSKH